MTNQMYYSTSSFDYEEKKCANCTSDMIKDEDDGTGMFAPVNLAIEYMLSGNPCSAVLHSGKSAGATAEVANQILQASASPLNRPPRQSLPQESMFDAVSVATTTSHLKEELDYDGFLKEELDLDGLLDL